MSVFHERTWRQRLELLALLGLFIALLTATWMRWPDALVDFWHNLYIPWRLSEGALLYVDVADWYGPLASLVAATAFSIFGPGLDVLVALNAVFVLVFCFGEYTMLGNYNLLTPYVSQATWGFFGVLLTIEGALANTKEESPRGWLLAGAGLAIAWLSKAETLLACAVVLLALTAEGGFVYGLRAFNQVIAFTLSPEVRATLAAVPLFSTDLGTDSPLINLAAHASRGAVLRCVMALVAFAPQAWRSGPRAASACAADRRGFERSAPQGPEEVGAAVAPLARGAGDAGAHGAQRAGVSLWLHDGGARFDAGGAPAGVRSASAAHDTARGSAFRRQCAGAGRERAAISYLARRPSPTPEFEFKPVSLGFSGADQVLNRLQAHPPDVVLLCSYDLRSHGTPFFGANDASGGAMAAWVKANYVKVPAGPPGALSITGHSWDLLALRTPLVTP